MKLPPWTRFLQYLREKPRNTLCQHHFSCSSLHQFLQMQMKLWHAASITWLKASPVLWFGSFSCNSCSCRVQQGCADTELVLPFPNGVQGGQMHQLSEWYRGTAKHRFLITQSLSFDVLHFCEPYLAGLCILIHLYRYLKCCCPETHEQNQLWQQERSRWAAVYRVPEAANCCLLSTLSMMDTTVSLSSHMLQSCFTAHTSSVWALINSHRAAVQRALANRAVLKVSGFCCPLRLPLPC